MRGFRLQFAGRIFLPSFACILLFVVFPCFGDQTAPSEILVIRHVALVDMGSATPQFDMDVVVKGDRITAIRKSESAPVPPHARLVEARNKFLIPGLWDNFQGGWLRFGFGLAERFSLGSNAPPLRLRADCIWSTPVWCIIWCMFGREWRDLPRTARPMLRLSD